jgi:hypothetical protein
MRAATVNAALHSVGTAGAGSRKAAHSTPAIFLLQLKLGRSGARPMNTTCFPIGNY